MKITVEGSPEEIAAFVTATQTLEVVPPSSEDIQRVMNRYNGMDLRAD